MDIGSSSDGTGAPGKALPEWNDRFTIVMVSPKYTGNIGSVARLGRNFGINRLILVNAPDTDDEAKAYSMHGRKILDDALRVDDFDQACDHVDFMVGTSGISCSAEKRHTRRPLTPEEMTMWARGISGRIGIALGREDFGLIDDELSRCDMLVTIPASPEYPILNISHAAGIILYELWKGSMPDYRRSARTIDNTEKRTMLEHYGRLLEIANVPRHKIPISMINFRRMMCRAAPNVREFYSFMGALSRAIDYKRDRSPFRERCDERDP